MRTIKYGWRTDDSDHTLEMVYVQGSGGHPFRFGAGKETRAREVASFFIATVPVTQALWTHVMGGNPSHRRGDCRPVEDVSWDDITGPDGFLHRINASVVLEGLAGQLSGETRAIFRLPSENEREYAARGGKHWPDAF